MMNSLSTRQHKTPRNSGRPARRPRSDRSRWGMRRGGRPARVAPGFAALGLLLGGCAAAAVPAATAEDAVSAGTAASSEHPRHHRHDSVIHLSPEGAIEPTGTWSLGTRAGDFVYVAGMRGIDPETNTLVEGDLQRVRQGFENMLFIAESAGAAPEDAARIVVYVTDMNTHRPLVNQVQEEIWGDGPYPPRTIVQVSALNQDDIFEVEGTFYAPRK